MVIPINDKLFQSLATGHWNSEQVDKLDELLAYLRQIKKMTIIFKSLGINVNDELSQLEYAEINLNKIATEARERLEPSTLQNDVGT